MSSTTLKKVKTETKRATVRELLDFANRVRAAGGGNPIDALMPAVPEDVTQCLIAKNLNFNCKVGDYYPLIYSDSWDASEEEMTEYNSIHDNHRWWMSLNNEETARNIARELRLKIGCRNDTWFVGLPHKYGKLAEDFDTVTHIAFKLDMELEEFGRRGRGAWDTLNRDEKKLFRDLWPYIDAAQKEAYSLATIVNEDGSIVI